MDELLDFLYYLEPMEYQMQLDGPQDPNANKVTQGFIDFEKYLKSCTFKEYCTILVQAFLSKYPKGTGLRISLLGFQDNGVFIDPTRPRRSAEVERIDFIYQKAMLFGRFVPGVKRNLKYLHELRMALKTPQPLLADWVAESLAGKAFTRAEAGGITTFSVTNSPILRVELEGKRFSIFIDKNSFIEYLYDAFAQKEGEDPEEDE